MAVKNKVIANPVSGQTIRFIQTSHDTEGELLEMESSFAPHSREPLVHYHPKQREEFKVLEGELSVRIEGSVRQLRAGDCLFIPPNTPHSMWNAGKNPARVNWKVMPAMTTEYLLETGMGLANDGKVGKNGMPPLLQSILIANKYSSVYRLAKPSYSIQKIMAGLLSPIARLAGYKSVYKKYLD